ncbi:MAG TPA: SidA/IucD/PvdA family monooxygenase [Pilimelia sp.]|nr:SidA/IucD/PvdA family monooxygenase [Pilimelia sp.]
MSTTAHDGADDVYDLLGIGFGPSNLALAIAVEEHNRAAPATAALRPLFLEKQHRFGWHRGMLIDDATMQVSFLKDLVTMRNPTSDFSFLCYLRERGRLVDFINHKTMFPLRIEFHDYFEWAAARVAHLVAYDSEVVSVAPVEVDGAVRWFDVICREAGEADRLVVRRARNICLATGLEPHLPPGATLSDRIWHNVDLVPGVERIAGAPLRRAIVVGAGQSAAEAVDYLHRRFPTAEVCAVFARYGYTPADDSPFANGVFDPQAVDLYYHAPREVKRRLFDYHRNTNYSVVDGDLIESLYRKQYQERVRGVQRLRILNASQIAQVRSRPDAVEVSVTHLPTGETTTYAADLLVYATGYRPVDAGRLLGDAFGLCARDDEGELRVGRDYRVETAGHVDAGIYLQGGTEHAHGITSTLLSNTAVRVGEILDSIRAHRRAPAGYARHAEAVR